MKVIKLQQVVGFLLVAWTGIGMAQNARIDTADTLRQDYKTLDESTPDMTEEQQQMFEHKMKAIRLQQEWKTMYMKKEDSNNAPISNDDQEEEQNDGVEYHIDQ